jgi:hypothetical protein
MAKPPLLDESAIFDKSIVTPFSVSSAGDVNGDGLDDLIIGSSLKSVNSGHTSKSFVVFGKTNGVTSDLSNIALSSNKGGFAISGNKAITPPEVR